jgi:hypothetical protein
MINQKLRWPQSIAPANGRSRTLKSAVAALTALVLASPAMVITLHALPPVSFYTEPANDNHFAETRGSPVLVRICGLGTAGTTYADRWTLRSIDANKLN